MSETTPTLRTFHRKNNYWTKIRGQPIQKQKQHNLDPQNWQTMKSAKAWTIWCLNHCRGQARWRWRVLTSGRSWGRRRLRRTRCAIASSTWVCWFWRHCDTCSLATTPCYSRTDAPAHLWRHPDTTQPCYNFLRPNSTCDTPQTSRSPLIQTHYQKSL